MYSEYLPLWRLLRLSFPWSPLMFINSILSLSSLLPKHQHSFTLTEYTLFFSTLTHIHSLTHTLSLSHYPIPNTHSLLPFRCEMVQPIRSIVALFVAILLAVFAAFTFFNVPRNRRQASGWVPLLGAITLTLIIFAVEFAAIEGEGLYYTHAISVMSLVENFLLLYSLLTLWFRLTVLAGQFWTARQCWHAVRIGASLLATLLIAIVYICGLLTIATQASPLSRLSTGFLVSFQAFTLLILLGCEVGVYLMWSVRAARPTMTIPLVLFTLASIDAILSLTIAAHHLSALLASQPQQNVAFGLETTHIGFRFANYFLLVVLRFMCPNSSTSIGRVRSTHRPSTVGHHSLLRIPALARSRSPRTPGIPLFRLPRHT